MTTKTKSAAYLKIEAKRDARHLDFVKLLDEDLSCVVFIGTDKKGRPIAHGYRGRSLKPAFSHYYPSTEKRTESVNKWMLNQTTANRTYVRQPRTLEIGDVLRSSWGYDQTNIDYYLVLRLIGKTQVVIIEIGSEIIQTGDMQGDCIPNPKNIIGDEMTKVADGDRVKIESFASASKITPKIIAGTKLYDASSWTAYH